MWSTLKKLLLGVVLICAAAAVLLLSDLRSRRSARLAQASAPAPGVERTFRVAMVQHSSQPVLDDGASGMLQGLAEKGFVEGKNLTVKRYNPQGDLPTANAIAKEVVTGDYDLILTISTPSLQTVANANKAGKIHHVFGLVTDPASAGVGVSRDDPMSHPPHLTGFRTMQPVEAAFRVALEMKPDLRRVGTLWNPSEANSEAQLKVARQFCKTSNIELLEANADNSSAVGEAAGSLIARGVEAIWLPGDVTVLAAADAVLQTARKGQVPAFTVIPPHFERGALFDLGADYHEVGRLAGLVAGDVLAGTDPAKIPIGNVLPERLLVNKLALENLRQPWNPPASLLRRANVVIDSTGKHTNTISSAAAAPAPVKPAVGQAVRLSKTWKIRMVNYNESPAAEETIHGVMDGLKASGLVADKDYVLKLSSAQGDMATLGTIFDAAQAERPDLYLVLSTPTLQVAVKKIRDVPVVFTFVANPMLAGAGQDYTNHLPNFTGISSLSPYAEMATLLERYYPQYKRVGTLFCPAEVNSVHNKESFTKEAASRGITLVTVPANTSSDLPDASAALCSMRIDAVVQIIDNLSAAGFTSISRAAQRAGLPLFSFNSSTIKQGAAVVVSRDFYEGGQEAAAEAVQIMRGANPANIPFSIIKKTRTLVHPGNASKLNMSIPERLLSTADEVVR